jgi:hypothetical protein
MTLWKDLVDLAARVRLQIRVVLVVFRSEMARMDRWTVDPETREDFSKALKSRSLQVLDSARAALNGTTPEHPDLVREIDEARAEVSAGD